MSGKGNRFFVPQSYVPWLSYTGPTAGVARASRRRIDSCAPQPHLDRMTQQRIVIDPAVCGGRPIVAGTRMRVSDVLDTLAAGTSVDELIGDFPYLTREDVRACLAYGARAVDHAVVQAA